MERPKYCKRLIEVDLPIKKISEHARREKSIRRGHIASLHIWWARRPLASCRSVLCAALWPDPADSLCPINFKEKAAKIMKDFRDRRGGKQREWQDPLQLREALLDFISDFADWDNSSNKLFLEVSQQLTMVAHETLGAEKGQRPLVVDSFAGGGAIPLEALRIGADAYGIDLNPVAAFIEKVVIEHVPKYGDRLAKDLEKYALKIYEELSKELSKFYPASKDGAKPLAYLWCRTAKCEGPNCGATIPLQCNMNIITSGKRSINYKVHIDRSKISFDISEGKSHSSAIPTVRRSSAVCPICGYTTKASSVRSQFKGRRGGANDAQLMSVMDDNRGLTKFRRYRKPSSEDLEAVKEAQDYLKKCIEANLISIPNEPLPYLRSIFNIKLLDVETWGDLFTDRQKLVNSLLVSKINKIYFQIDDKDYAEALVAMLALFADKIIDSNSSLCFKVNNADTCMRTFGRQALPIIWDFVEINPVADWARGIRSNINNFVGLIGTISKWNKRAGNVLCDSATNHLFPDDSVECFITDPPYYDAIPYADLSDFYYVWLKNIYRNTKIGLFSEKLTPKRKEIVQLFDRNKNYFYKTKENYIDLMQLAMTKGRKFLKSSGIAIIIFAHKATDAWEAQLQSMIDAGWVICASWPIHSENDRRLRAQSAAVLSSSIHLVCRPRENLDGSLITDNIGDWRDVLQELPKRIHEWMPRLAEENVVGADAIFSCLGPALEIFSQYSHVEKANGYRVELREYLEHVWAAVAKEALNMIFKGAHTEGFEEDSRLTAMWLWTLSTSANGNGKEKDVSTADEDENASSKAAISSGFSLEFDAARKIAQGLGAHLQKLSDLIEIKGDKARLLPVSERVKSLFEKDSRAASTYKRKKKEKQLTLFDELKTVQEEDWSLGDTKAEVGKTVLDRLHQSMILFGAGRGEAVRRLLVEEGVGKDERFWQLAQALSALYPSSTDEKRWVDGVLARKKGLGF